MMPVNVRLSRTVVTKPEAWEPAAVRSHTVFGGELDPLALMDGDRKKETALRDVESVRRFRTLAANTHTQTHAITLV